NETLAFFVLEPPDEIGDELIQPFRDHGTRVGRVDKAVFGRAGGMKPEPVDAETAAADLEAPVVPATTEAFVKHLIERHSDAAIMNLHLRAVRLHQNKDEMLG